MEVSKVTNPYFDTELWNVLWKAYRLMRRISSFGYAKTLHFVKYTKLLFKSIVHYTMWLEYSSYSI